MHSTRGRWLASVVSLGLVLSFAPGTAHAWQTVKSGAGGTKVLATPTPDGTLTGNVDPGKPLTIGDKATSGFYRCNAGKGLNGWCEETELDFGSKGKAASNSTGQPGADAVRNSKWHKGSGALETNMYAGLLVGLGFYSGGTKLGFGVDGGYKLGPDWALGLYVTYTSVGGGTDATAAAGISASGSSIILAPEINYWLPGELKGLHLGGKIGLNLASASISGSPVAAANTSVSSTNIVFGVAGGYDYPITHDITIGGEANFLIISSSGSSDTTSTTTTTTSSGSSSVFNILVSAKYWL